jgi:hypothetical protein
MRRSVFFSVLGAAAATFLLGGTYALATTMSFVLGSTANAPDALTAAVAKNVDAHGGLNGPMIRLTNNSTAGNATALALGVGSKRPPFTTTSSARVANLNADQLDGIDSTGFVQGAGGKLLSNRAQVVPGDSNNLIMSLPSRFDLGYDCPGDLTQDGAIRLVNRSAASVDVVVDEDGFTNVRSVGAGGTAFFYTADSYAAQMAFSLWWTDGRMANMWVFSFHKDNQPDPRDNGCYVHTMALVR